MAQSANSAPGESALMIVPSYRLALVVGVFVSLLLLLALKVWQVALEQSSPDPLGCGVCRRVDDVSFWSAVNLLCLSIFATAGTSKPTVILTQRMMQFTVASSTLGVLLYLTIIARGDNPGGFFHRSTGLIKAIQCTEGLIMIGLIIYGHWLLTLMTKALLDLQGRAAAVKRRRVVAGTLLLVTCGTLLGLLEPIRSAISTVCTACPPSTAPQTLLVITYVIAIWWPLAIFLCVWLWAIISHGSEALIGDDGANGREALHDQQFTKAQPPA
jgi:hypothetical protein